MQPLDIDNVRICKFPDHSYNAPVIIMQPCMGIHVGVEDGGLMGESTLIHSWSGGFDFHKSLSYLI